MRLSKYEFTKLLIVILGITFCMIGSSVLFLITSGLLIKDLGVFLIFSLIKSGKPFTDCINYIDLTDIFCVDSVTSTEEIDQQSMKQGYPVNVTNIVSYIFYQ